MAVPIRGGGVKALPLRKSKTNFKLRFFLFCCHLKIQNILIKSTYRNMDISSLSYWFVTIFSKKQGYLSPKVGREIKLSKSDSGYSKIPG